MNLELLRDDPRDGSSRLPDALGRKTYARYLANLMATVASQSESSVVALVGEWGAGKSSLLEMVKVELALNPAEGKDWLIGSFNPWMFSDPESLQRGFFAELIEALPENHRPTGARKKVGDLAQALSPLGKLGSLVGLDAESLVKAVGKYVAGDVSVSAAKRSAEEALRRIGRPVLLTLDDLDRLTPEELLEVLKLVRLVGRLPHVYYLLAYDERTLLDILKRTPVAGTESRARDYLEKIVQVRADMPVFRSTQWSSLLEEGIDHILQVASRESVAIDRARMGRLADRVLRPTLTSPRALRRFLGQVQALYPALEGEVDFIDFAVLTWIRTYEPGVFTLISRRRDELLGRDWSRSWPLDRDGAAQEKRRSDWSSALSAAGVDEARTDIVVDALGLIFPVIAAVFVDANYWNNQEAATVARGIGDVDYFDRYMNFGVAEDDTPDTEIAESVRALCATDAAEPTEYLGVALMRNSDSVIRKLERLRGSGSPMPESKLLALYASAWESSKPRYADVHAESRVGLERGAASSVLGLPESEGFSALSCLALNEGAEEFCIAVIRMLLRGQRTSLTIPISEAARENLRQLGEELLGKWFDRQAGPARLSDDSLDHIWDWREISPEGLKRALLRKVDRGDWELIDAVAALTSVAIPYREEPPFAREVAGFDADFALEVFGPEVLFEQLPFEGFSDEDAEVIPFGLLASGDNRRRVALDQLNRRRPL